MAIVYRPANSPGAASQIQRAGSSSQGFSSSVGDANQQIAEFWTREEAALFEQWASSFDSYNAALQNPYFDYFYSGEDISVQIEGLDPLDKLAITSFAYNIQQQKQPVYGFWNYCVDDQTEAFTKRGWVHGNDLTEDDTILSMDITGKLVWGPVLEIYRNPNFNGKMHRLIGSNSIDALVTDGHKFALFDGTLKKIDDLNKTDVLRVMGSAVDDRYSKYSDELVILLSLFHGFSGAYSMSKLVFSVPHSHHDDFERYLKRTQLPFYDEYAATHMVYKVDTHSPNIPLDLDFLMSISTHQRELMSEILGQSVYPIDRELDIALHTLLGVQTKVKKNTTTYGLESFGTHNVKVMGLVMPGYQDSRKGLKNVPTEKYKGLVWCPKTEYGTFVCRRNGQTYVTGNTYSAMLRGTRIVTGAFSVASTGPVAFTQLLAKAAAVRAKARTSSEIPDFHSLRGIDEDEANIDKYWRRHLDNSLLAGQQHIFSVHPPFNFILQYGLQETSLVSNNPEVRAEEFKDTFRRTNVRAQDYNERLVKNPSEQDDFTVLLENVELIGKQVQYDANGDPIVEIYSFMARDEKFLSESVYTQPRPMTSSNLGEFSDGAVYDED